MDQYISFLGRLSGVGIVSILLALAVLCVIWIGYRLRHGNGKTKGVGWQFIRYTVISIGIPIAGILALNDALTEAAATIIAGALGYAFGNSGQRSNTRRADRDEQ